MGRKGSSIMEYMADYARQKRKRMEGETELAHMGLSSGFFRNAECRIYQSWTTPENIEQMNVAKLVGLADCHPKEAL